MQKLPSYNGEKPETYGRSTKKGGRIRVEVESLIEENETQLIYAVEWLLYTMTTKLTN